MIRLYMQLCIFHSIDPIQLVSWVLLGLLNSLKR